MDTNNGQSSPNNDEKPASGGTPGEVKARWRKTLIDKRQAIADRGWRNDMLQRVMRVWLINRPDAVIGAYWPIKGEFDPLPALFRWQEAGLEEDAQGQQRHRRISLPVINKIDKTLTFHTWYPGCPMEEDAYGIPKPKDTEVVEPTLIFVPCVGYGPGGYRLGYGGGYFDRYLAAHPEVVSIGLGWEVGDIPPERWTAGKHDIPLMVVITERHTWSA